MSFTIEEEDGPLLPCCTLLAIALVIRHELCLNDNAFGRTAEFAGDFLLDRKWFFFVNHFRTLKLTAMGFTYENSPYAFYVLVVPSYVH